MKPLFLCLALSLAACTPEPAPQASAHAAPSPATCVVTYVVDGDTLHLDCGSGRIKARLLGFDTPEVSHPQCAAERVAADHATALLQAMVASGPITGARFDGVDRYGRALVALQIGGQDVAQAMIASGFARPYSGHRHPDWCAIFS